MSPTLRYLAITSQGARKRKNPNFSPSPIAFDFTTIFGDEGGSRRRPGVTSIAQAFREFCQLKSTYEPRGMGKGAARSVAPRSSRSERVLGGMFLDAAVSLIEIDYPVGPGSIVFPRRRRRRAFSLPPRREPSHNYQGHSLRCSPDIPIFRGECLASPVRPIHVHGSASPPCRPFCFVFSPSPRNACPSHPRRLVLSDFPSSFDYV